MTVQAAVNLALQGETHRIYGNYSEAITKFTEALVLDGGGAEANSSYAWAWAHRGAAKGALGRLVELNQAGAPVGGALDDLNTALAIRTQTYPWAQAQKGEAIRMWARDNLWAKTDADDQGSGKAVKHPDVEGLLDIAVQSFNLAIDGSSTIAGQPSPWMVAHRGALHTLRYFLKRFILWQGPDGIGAQAGQYTAAIKADDDFTKAVVQNAVYPSNSSYPWCLAFHAILLVLRSTQLSAANADPGNAAALRSLAQTKLQQALLLDVNHRLTVLRPFALLAHYSGGYDEAITTGWQALQENSDDLWARYVVTAALVMKSNSGSRPTDPLLLSGIRETRLRIQNLRTLLTVMLGGLDLLEGYQDQPYYSRAKRALDKLSKEPDFDAYTLVNLDPTWTRLKTADKGQLQPPK